MRNLLLRPIVIMILTIVMGGCFPLPEGPCAIDTLLIDETVLPTGTFKETGSRSADGAPARVGIEKIGTSYSSTDQGGLVFDVYRFWDVNGASDEFNDVAKYYFIPEEYETDWITPVDLMSLPIQADRYKLACANIKKTDVEICQFVAQYDAYIVYMNVDMIALDHNDLLFIIENIDRRFESCLAE